MVHFFGTRKYQYILASLFLFACTQVISKAQYFDFLEQDLNVLHKHFKAKSKEEETDWTIVIYAAADNDLRGFIARNIKQMARIGSNKNINILVHLDIKIAGNKKVTRRYYIEKDKFIHVNAYDSLTQSMDSGNKHTLTSCCKWAITDFPAKHYALVFWNHGSGVIDPAHGRILSTANLLFSFNPTTKQFELDRSINFFDFMEELSSGLRGICWDDSTGNYLTNHDLEDALTHIRKKYLNNKKFDIIAFDACFMGSIEIASIIKNHADIMVASEEVELGAGWNYEKVLAPFKTNSISPFDFAEQMVSAYYSSYHKITSDYTQSAFNLSLIPNIEQNINSVAQELMNCIDSQKNSSVTKGIQASRNKNNCTHFSEPSYIDLHHFYSNLLQATRSFKCNKVAQQKLKGLLSDGISLVEETIFAHTEGKNLRRSHGASIYFPEHRNIHSSYLNAPFNLDSWIDFLKVYRQL